MGINITSLFRLAPLVLSVVQSVQAAFSHKPGTERKDHAMDAVNDALEIADVLRDPGLSDETKDRIRQLVSDSIEDGVEVMKIEQRIEARLREIKALRGQKAA